MNSAKGKTIVSCGFIYTVMRRLRDGTLVARCNATGIVYRFPSTTAVG